MLFKIITIISVPIKKGGHQIQNTDISEKGFQKYITKYLVETNKYAETFSNDFNRELRLDKIQLFEFIKNSPPENYDFIIKKESFLIS